MPNNITRYIEVRTPEHHYRYGALLFSCGVAWVDARTIIVRAVRAGLLSASWWRDIDARLVVLSRDTSAAQALLSRLCDALTAAAAPGWEFTCWFTPYGRAWGWFPRQG